MKRHLMMLRDIQKLFKSARKQVSIVDAHVDDTIFELYLKYVHPNTKIKLLTETMHGLFRTVAERFKVQKQNFEVKKVRNIHDRYLIIDGKIWAIGSSLNYAGTRPLYLIELSERKRVLNMFENFWKTGEQVV